MRPLTARRAAHRGVAPQPVDRPQGPAEEVRPPARARTPPRTRRRRDGRAAAENCLAQ